MPSPKYELRVDAATRARWQAAADADGVTLGSWVKRACQAALPAAAPARRRQAGCVAGATGRCEHRIARGAFCRTSGGLVT